MRIVSKVHCSDCLFALRHVAHHARLGGTVRYLSDISGDQTVHNQLNIDVLGGWCDRPVWQGLVYRAMLFDISEVVRKVVGCICDVQNVALAVLIWQTDL